MELETGLRVRAEPALRQVGHNSQLFPIARSPCVPPEKSRHSPSYTVLMIYAAVQACFDEDEEQSRAWRLYITSEHDLPDAGKCTSSMVASPTVYRPLFQLNSLLASHSLSGAPHFCRISCEVFLHDEGFRWIAPQMSKVKKNRCRCPVACTD